MGEYPRIASLGLDTEKLCARIDRCANPKENEMTPSENIYRSDYDEIDGLVDVEGYCDEMMEGVDDYHEDDYYDDSMDGDFDSVMRDAGFGTDEDYGYYGEDY